MSFLDTAITRLYRYIDGRVHDAAPYRATVDTTDGDLVFIQRPGVNDADAEPSAKVTADVLGAGDEVMVLPVLGKPVVIGKVRRTEAPGGVVHLPVPFASHSNISASNTTLTGEGDTIISIDLSPPEPGTYRVSALATCTVQRDVADGGIQVGLKIDDTMGVRQLVSGTSGIASNRESTVTRAFTHEVAIGPSETIPVSLLWRGIGTAGTTIIWYAHVSGWYQRIA